MSMAMVVVWHFILKCLLVGSPDGPVVSDSLCSVEGGVIMFSCSLLGVAVNVFVLISGYFGIKLSLRSLLKIWLLCLFYNLAACAVNAPADGWTVKQVVKCFDITKTQNWFFPAYFWLMFFAPICNSCLRTFDIVRLRVLVALLLWLNVFSGLISGYGANATGYTVMHLMLIYMVGGYLRREDVKVRGRWCALGYVALAAVNTVLCFAYVSLTHKNGFVVYDYNNPVVIAEAVSLFLLFKGLRLRSAVVNSIAKTVVAVLLISEVVMPKLMTAHLKGSLQEGFGPFLLAATGWFLFFFVAAYVVERVRQPIANGVTRLLLRIIPEKYAGMQL